MNEFDKKIDNIEKLAKEAKKLVESFDFSEHDKVFEDRIAKKWELIDKLYKENVRLEEKCMKKDADIHNLQCENRALEKLISELESKETEKPKKYITVIVSKEINGQTYVTFDDFMSVVNDLQAEIGT